MTKRIFDLIISAFLLVPLTFLFVFIALLIKLDSKGSVFFIQERIGKNGNVFKMFKFRTMVDNVEKMGPGSDISACSHMSGSLLIPADLFSYSDDPRITRFGKFLRMTSLDETPQIINVLLGNMSLVGPRPPVTYELGDYKDFSETMKIRFKVKPGITGLAQISGRNDLDWDQKIVFDNIYVEKFQKNGIKEDFIILVKTLFIVLSMKNVIENKTEK